MSASGKRMLSGSLALFLMALSANAYADPVERVVAIDVHNASAQMAALDALFSSDLMDGQQATLWAHMFRGSSPADRVLVIGFDSFEELAENTERVVSSPEWAAFQQAVDGASDVISNSMAQQLWVEGSGWTEHGGLIAVAMTVTDLPAYMAAFGEMIDSVGNPGSVRLMQIRYGGGATNTVALFSAPDPSAANAYVDGLQAHEAFQVFAAEVAGIRTINNISMLRRVQSWGN